MSKHIYVINGKPGSGKDTFIDMIKDITSNDFYPKVKVYNISSIDIVKDLAKKLGWDGEKTPTNRNMLSEYKEFLEKYFSIPTKYLDEEISKVPDYNNEESLVFVHIREIQEIEKFKQRYPSARTIQIINPRIVLDEDITNKSDLDTDDYKYDVDIINNSTLYGLKKGAMVFLLCDTLRVCEEDNNGEEEEGLL